MKKIAIVNQRYGMEVNGGSEYYTRLISEHLTKKYEVEVLTTTALDYDTWKNHYQEGEQEVNGVYVRRFRVKKPRSMIKFKIISKLTSIVAEAGIHVDKLWVREQGPQTPDLIRYIKQNKNNYDVFVFVTYLYYTTVIGMPEVAYKSILIPTAHDEPYIFYPIYKKIFESSCGILFLTDEEREFVLDNFAVGNISNDVIGVGIDIPANMMDKKCRDLAIKKFREKYHIQGEYFIYVGRVDVGKNCDEMFSFLQEYNKYHSDNMIQLVVIGKEMIQVPKSTCIHNLGFVSEEDKYAGIAGAKILWMPSRFESLSMSLLEGMAMGVPGLVNGNCKVLRGHCTRSGGAFSYKNWQEFEYAVNTIQDFTNIEYQEIRNKAESYVKKQYQWHVVEAKLSSMIEGIVHD